MAAMVVAPITDTQLITPGKGGAKSAVRRASLESRVDVDLCMGAHPKHLKKRPFYLLHARSEAGANDSFARFAGAV